jgi:uncharacterized protein (TIGR00369 family)
MISLQQIEAMVRGEAPPPPIGRLLGFAVRAIEPGKAMVTLSADERFANPMGTLHGGVLCDIADAAMGLAYAATLAEGETFTTLELKINFLKPIWKANLEAVGWVIQRGRTIGLTACEIRDEAGKLVAHATSTCMTLRGEQARGR